MHLCFVDESGTPAKPGSDRPKFFVIAGVVIPEDRWHLAHRRLQGLKIRSRYRGELKWRFFAPGNDDAGNPMKGWTTEARNELREAAFNIISQDRSIRIIAGVCQASAAYALPRFKTQDDLYFGTYKVVSERFQYLLQDISRIGGSKTHGIIVADHRGKGDDESMRVRHQRLVEEEQEYTSTYMNLVEGLFFAPSHMSVGIQLADMVAGAIGRRFESNDSTWFAKIAGSFRTSAEGKIDGFGIARFPKKGWTGPVP